MDNAVHDISEKSPDAMAHSQRHEESRVKNTKSFAGLDWVSLSTFGSGAVLGAVTIAHNIRNAFWNGVVLGYKETRTAFSDITDKYTNLFKNNTEDYLAGKYGEQEYLRLNRGTSKQYRGEVFERLEKKFDIPSNGFKGWTVGTFKRFKELGVNARIHSGIGFASVGATVIGAVTLLRHNSHTVHRIEEKIDQEASQKTR
jgi:hypothetical protein